MKFLVIDVCEPFDGKSDKGDKKNKKNKKDKKDKKGIYNKY